MKDASLKLLTNHGVVLLCLARDSGIRLRDIADAVGITERAAHAILSDLVEEGFVIREKRGRRNAYAIVADQPLHQPLLEHHKVGNFLKLLELE